MDTQSPIPLENVPREVESPLWLSVSESAKIAGLQKKTIRRAIEAGKLKFKVVGNRYLLNITPLIIWLLGNTKLRNKFMKYGLGQYVDKWK